VKRALVIALLVLPLAMAWPQGAKAVSPSPVPEENEERIERGVVEKGDTVCLFESGTVDVRRQIATGDILVVYRQDAAGSLRPVGKIRVLSYAGENYVKAEVAEGKLMTGDVAKRGDAAGLVIFSGDRCR
jgi:hypothetical protein